MSLFLLSVLLVIQLLLWYTFGKPSLCSHSMEFHSKCHQVVAHPCRNIFEVRQCWSRFFWTELRYVIVRINFVCYMQPNLVLGISVLQIIFNQYGCRLWLPLLQICREWELWLAEDFALFFLLYNTLPSSHSSSMWWDGEQYNKMHRLFCVMSLI